jgi:hypothetical protein
MPTDAQIAQAVANRATLESHIPTAIANNVTYLGLASPTNAQVVAQVQALTRQIDGLVRLLYSGQFDTITDS